MSVDEAPGRVRPPGLHAAGTITCRHLPLLVDALARCPSHCAHVLSGSARFTPDDGSAPVALAAGDVVFFAAHTHGIWDIEHTVRKVYVLLGE